ncbi:putative ferric-chelate reductase 1 [Gouania willdenowi]|uniref:putative ferric-chelate reductase 1 n=1 Tax=Gouania willdenowi TaxID=441366 RepID=UPI001055BEAC|nr:putative ferric-chelate reductase 1 [Gouania willdenowi]
MTTALILLMAMVMVSMVHHVQGTSHLSFANNTEVNITRAGCGDTKLCVQTPDGCDPAASTQCLFASLNASTTMAPNGTDLSVELSGNSSGYIALGLTANASQGTTLLFICAQNNGSFFFRTMTRNNSNSMISPSETRVTEIRGSVNGDMIQCEFIIPGANATDTRSSNDTMFIVILGQGPVNGTAIGSFNETLRTDLLNVSDPSSNVAPTPTSNTTSSASTSAAHLHDVLLLLLPSVLSVSLLKTN